MPFVHAMTAPATPNTMKLTFTRDYPLETIHEGTMLGNGFVGLFVWGKGRTLNITLGCASLWDHRGGVKWTPRQNYRDIRQALKDGDKGRLDDIFAPSPEEQASLQPRPTLIPAGRLEITLAPRCMLRRNELNRGNGILRIAYESNGRQKTASLFLMPEIQDSEESLFLLKCDDVERFRVIPSFNLCPALSNLGFAPPRILRGKTFHGFVQPMPADVPFGMALHKREAVFTGIFRRMDTPDALAASLTEETAAFPCKDIPLWRRNKNIASSWWRRFWKTIPAVSTGSDTLDEIYVDGIYKFGAMTAPTGVPAGLQGPWLEDNALPPWSGDYHLNINVEMCYWPAFRAGLWKNLRKMLDMVWSWREILRQNAKFFIGTDDGYMIPHAVDDRCVCMGAFWTGTIDHACSAWIAQMMFDYADYSGDMEYLRDVAFDFMKGTMNVFLAMMETRPDGSLALPLTVSPEYRADAINAWGANSSFQLAAVHRLARNLLTASEWLGIPADPAWKKVMDHLPVASVVDGEIAIWEGLALEESHRHHSHLAALCPFDVIDPESPQWHNIVEKSANTWKWRGMAGWTGWCLPWAAMIENRLDFADAAELIMNIWKFQFTNKGGGSLGFASADGIFAYRNRRDGSLCLTDPNGTSTSINWPPVMQMDGAMGAVTAVQDMLLHDRQGTIHLFAGLGARHENASFSSMRAPGGFVISAIRSIQTDDDVAVVTVNAMRDNTLKLVCHCNADTVIVNTDTSSPKNITPASLVVLPMKKGETAVLHFKITNGPE